VVRCAISWSNLVNVIHMGRSSVRGPDNIDVIHIVVIAVGRLDDINVIHMGRGSVRGLDNVNVIHIVMIAVGRLDNVDMLDIMVIVSTICGFDHINVLDIMVLRWTIGGDDIVVMGNLIAAIRRATMERTHVTVVGRILAVVLGAVTGWVAATIGAMTTARGVSTAA